MSPILAALAILIVSGLGALILARQAVYSSLLAVAGVVVAAVLGLIPAVAVLQGGQSFTFRQPWAVPLGYGEWFLELDALSAWFLVPILLLSALAAIYGHEYLASQASKKALGPAWFFYNLLVASMIVVVLAKNALLFLVAWEVMALASFFLVTFEDEREDVQQAGWIYLVATHLGTAFLLAFFLIQGQQTGSLNFNDWVAAGPKDPRMAGLLFLLAVVGFGTKAGFMPFHVWLPEAHPAAPSHVSALMSGVMIKTGIYGLLRALTFLGPPSAWWGWTLIGIGLSSGILGVLFALAQQDMKRLLAYSSVENIGIIALGMGIGLTGLSAQQPALAVLGFGGALLHVLNHAFFKGLLFLGAGSVVHGSGTRSVDRLGGLLKRMPWTGVTFLVGAVAISGLPPFNGFVSELLIFLGGYSGAISPAAPVVAPGLTAIAGLALIGGLAAACFTKAFGIVFLGEPRSAEASHAHEAGLAMRWPMAILAAGCVLIGLTAPWLTGGLAPVIQPLVQSKTAVVLSQLAPPCEVMKRVVICVLVAGTFVVLLSFLRRRLLAGRKVSSAVTWDCGYAGPTARMQYTASSFSQPLVLFFRGVLRTREQVAKPGSILPDGASFASDTPDLCHEELYRPLFERLSRNLAKLRCLQQGRVQLYVLYIAVTLLVLLIWKLG